VSLVWLSRTIEHALACALTLKEADEQKARYLVEGGVLNA
jgi:hypothetical protein